MKIVYNTDQISTHEDIGKEMCTKVNYMIITADQQGELCSCLKINYFDCAINYSLSRYCFSNVSMKKIVQCFKFVN